MKACVWFFHLSSPSLADVIYGIIVDESRDALVEVRAKVDSSWYNFCASWSLIWDLTYGLPVSVFKVFFEYSKHVLLLLFEELSLLFGRGFVTCVKDL